MSRRARQLSTQLVVRMEPDLHTWLQELADEGGRTLAQTVRWILRRYMNGEIQ